LLPAHYFLKKQITLPDIIDLDVKVKKKTAGGNGLW